MLQVPEQDQDTLELQTLVIECARKLYEADENPEAIQEVLRMSGEYLESDRVYIFEIQGENMHNTHEWCAPGVKPQIFKLQNIPVSYMDYWRTKNTPDRFIIQEDLEELKENAPEVYHLLKEQEIDSLIILPLYLHNERIGYVGVDNFSARMKNNTTSFLNAIGYFIASMIRQQRAMAEMERMSYYDLLTGLKNRNAYMRDLQKECRTSAGVVYLNINGMKELNHRQGHEYGDEVLCMTGRALQKTFTGAECYRIGGDEFIAVCEDVEYIDLCERAQQLKNYFRYQKKIEISAGVSWKKKCDSIRELVAEADTAMSADKKEFYRGHALSGRYRSQSDDILGVGNPAVLHKMIEAGQFLVYYQPKINIKSRRITGAEALVRYQDAEGGFYPPDQFIPILEETRLISILDFYMFESVCRQIEEWIMAETGVVPIAVNFSRHTLTMPGFAERLQNVYGRYSFSKELLEIEITETVEADNRKQFYDALEELKKKGFRISIDDFGVNNANFALLTDVDFDVLKIDKQMIDSLCSRKKTRLLIASLIHICHKLKIEVTAEGVEEEEQFKILEEMSCDTVQGYLFGKPIPVGEFCGRFLSEQEDPQRTG